MKPKDYVKKYDFSSPFSFNHPDFITDLSQDFFDMITIHEANKNFNFTIFKNCITSIRDKWDRIEMLSKNSLPDKLWSYFYSTVIIKTKESKFPKESQEKKRKSKFYNYADEFESIYERIFKDMFMVHFFQTFAGSMFDTDTNDNNSFNWFHERNNRQQNTNNSKSEKFNPFKFRKTEIMRYYDIMGFSEGEEITIEILKTRYRTLAKTYHPDAGGDAEKFIEMTEACEKIIEYIKNK